MCMNIVKMKDSYISFKSGMTPKVLSNEKCIDVKLQEQIFTCDYGIEANFLSNKSCALANKYCLKIFEVMFKNKVFVIAFPPAITIYNKNNVINENSSSNFCIPDTKEVLIDDNPFPGRSIFFQNFNNLEEINQDTERLYSSKVNSSSHFLAPFIHEWIHSLHLDYIFRRFGYGGDCYYMNTMYTDNSKQSGLKLIESLENKILSPKENEIVFDILGEYSTQPVNQYLEVFSEAITKFICDSLSGIELKLNPFKQLEKTPKEFQDIFRKVSSLH